MGELLISKKLIFFFTSVNPAGHLNFQQNQHYQRMTASSHGHFDRSSQDRSAWSHLLSLEPSMTSSAGLSGALPGAQHLQDPFPSGHIKGSMGFTSASTKPRGHPPMHYSPVTSSSLLQGNLSEMPIQSLSQEKISQHLGQLMNLSKSTMNSDKVPLSKPLTVSTEFSSLESSGDYSPVSPPAAPPAFEDPLLDLTRRHGKEVKMPSRQPPTSTMSIMPEAQLQGPPAIMNPLSAFMGAPSSFTHQRPLDVLSQVPFSASALGTQKPSASPSDMPLDMTTAVAGKSDFTETNAGKQMQDISSSLSIEGHEKRTSEKFELSHEPTAQFFDIGLSSNLVSDRKETLPVLKTVQKTSVSNHGFTNHSQLLASASASNVAPLSLSQEKNIKMPKSTPKKSNFYGRDASLFAFSDENIATTIPPAVSLPMSSSHSVTPSVNMNSTIVTSQEEGLMSTTDFTQPSEMKPQLFSSVQSEIKSLPSDVSLQNPKDPGTFSINDLSSATHPPQASEMSGPSLILDTNNLSSRPALEGSQKVEENEDIQPNINDNAECEPSLIQNNEPSQVEEVESDVLKFEVASNSKPQKGRKRKTLGVVKRTRKQTPKRGKNIQHVPDVPQSVVVLERTNIIVSPLDGKVQGNGSGNEQGLTEKAAQGNPGMGKKKNMKAGDEKNAPRRSSSRKSKDNAMRLIELQADAGYVSIPGVDEDLVPKRMSRKRTAAAVTAGKVSSQSELSDLSGDSSSSDEQMEEKDDDYVVDEEEAAAVEKDELVDEEKLSNKTFVSKKKPGSLRISIKLSGDSSAEIVSGIDDSPVKKKRKPPKKKAVKNKSKANLKPENDPVPVKPENDPVPVKPENDPVPVKPENDLVPKDMDTSEQGSKEQVQAQLISTSANLDAQTSDIQRSLMEKYFSTVTAAKKNLGAKPAIKANKAIAKNLKPKQNKSFLGKNKKLSPKKSQVLPDKDIPGPNTSKSDSSDAIDVPKFRCGYCPQRYHTKTDLLTHMDEHMSEMESKDGGNDSSARKNYIQGSEKVSGPDSLDKKHDVKMVEDKVSPKDKLVALSQQQKFKCGECEKVFKSKSLLLDHVRCHTADKPFECDICHKCFANRTLLSAHRKTHMHEDLLRCQVCSKAFIHKADLDHHMQSHPKRTGGVMTSVKSSVSSKNVKKIGKNKLAETQLPSTKKTSFASALSGDTDDSSMNNGVPGVLVLKRKEASVSSAPKTKSESLSKNSVTGLPNLKVNPSNVKSNSVNKVVKSDPTVAPQKRGSDVEKESTGGKAPATQVSEIKPKEETSSGVCTCKECPDCVTRFLQSFV